MRGRFAPSPTGLLHLGNVRSALLGWLQARRADGEFWLRIENLDPERSRPHFIDAIFRDLEYLGLTWDGPVWRQSERSHLYDAALETLRAKNRVYPCVCSRADIARASSAPHIGEEGPIYPGTCTNVAVPPSGPAGLRFRVERGVETFVDDLHGAYSQDIEHQVGDFLVRRPPLEKQTHAVASYQLAVVVDDIASNITHVLRGDDLLSSTPRQIQLYRALLPSTEPGVTGAHPRYAHVPLLMQPDGRRLAKREGATTVAGLREKGVPAEHIIGLLAKWSGLGDGSPISAQALAKDFSLDRVRREPTVVHEAELDRLINTAQ